MLQVWTDILLSCPDYTRHRFWRWWEASNQPPTSRTSYCLCCFKLRFSIGWIFYYLLNAQFRFHMLLSAKCFEVRNSNPWEATPNSSWGFFASWKIFLSSYAGLVLPIVCINLCLFSLFLNTNFFFLLLWQTLLQCFGAAVAIAVSSVPAWEQGYAGGNVGGLLEAILSPLGNFGKFLTVLLSLSLAGNNVVAFYSISINLQAFMPFLSAVPRYVFSVVATAM